MATHPNFYENLGEALSRLKSTVVTYEGEPYLIWTITDHKGDGKFRVYMSPVEAVQNMHVPVLNSIPHGHSGLGPALDEWMQANPAARIVRKMMNSPGFNRFRPFPLGMFNDGKTACYLERIPSRPKMEQGLQSSMIMVNPVSCFDSNRAHVINLYSESFKDCVLGRYPSPKEILEKLSSGKFTNISVAFDREFALVRGPVGTLFLAYRENVIGFMPKGDFSRVQLPHKFLHFKEVVEELNLFYTIDKM
jgi:hypothetical protein